MLIIGYIWIYFNMESYKKSFYGSVKEVKREVILKKYEKLRKIFENISLLYITNYPI